MVYHIVYRSVKAKLLELPEMLALLQAARGFNRSRAISGVLLCSDSQYFQVLEGPAAEVQALWQRIQKDERHVELELLAAGNFGEKRFFGDWAMGFHHMKIMDRMEIAGLLSADLLPIFAKLGQEEKHPVRDLVLGFLQRHAAEL